VFPMRMISSPASSISTISLHTQATFNLKKHAK
jgi:hypothetical protein